MGCGRDLWLWHRYRLSRKSWIGTRTEIAEPDVFDEGHHQIDGTEYGVVHRNGGSTRHARAGQTRRYRDPWRQSFRWLLEHAEYEGDDQGGSNRLGSTVKSRGLNGLRGLNLCNPCNPRLCFRTRTSARTATLSMIR